MPRSKRRSFAYSWKSRGDRMTPALCSDSAAERIVAPGGMVTRAGSVSLGAQPSSSPVASATAILLARAPQRMLQKHGGGQRVDVTRPVLRIAADLPHGATRLGRRVTLVDELHRQTRTPLEFERDDTNFLGAGRVIALSVERQSDHEGRRLQLPGASDQLCDRRSLAGASRNEARGRRDHASGIADGETDPSLAPIHTEHASPRVQRQAPCTICWKNSLLLFERDICLSKN